MNHIDYLKQMIAQEEDALSRASNPIVKDAITKRLNSYIKDLKSFRSEQAGRVVISMEELMNVWAQSRRNVIDALTEFVCNQPDKGVACNGLLAYPRIGDDDEEETMEFTHINYDEESGGLVVGYILDKFGDEEQICECIEDLSMDEIHFAMSRIEQR